MPTVSTFLNFNGNCEAAFNFYKSVFGGEFTCFAMSAANSDQLDGEFLNTTATLKKLLIMRLEPTASTQNQKQ